MNRVEALNAALDAVDKRPKAYGPPEQNFERIANLWNDYIVGKFFPDGATPVPLGPIDVACMMALMKIARLEETPDHEDSWVDLAGYAACGAEVSTGARTASPAPEVKVARFKVGDRVWTPDDSPAGHGTIVGCRGDLFAIRWDSQKYDDTSTPLNCWTADDLALVNPEDEGV